MGYVKWASAVGPLVVRDVYQEEVELEQLLIFCMTQPRERMEWKNCVMLSSVGTMPSG
jgi:hypothetical protein